MRRSFFLTVPLSLAITALGACSLLNAPEDVRSGSGGSADGGACSAASDCPPPPSNEPCKVAVCTEAHECTIELASDGMGCDDHEPCTTGEVCTKGVCGGGGPTDCSAGDNECSKSACMVGFGCVRSATNNNLPCDTGNPCAQSTCNAGKCTVDLNSVKEGDACDDGLFCTDADACDATGKCAGTKPKCVPTASCVDAVCDEAAQMCNTVQIADGAPCEDGDACTGGETCSSNACKGGVAPKVLFSDDFSKPKAWVLGMEWQIGVAKVSPDDGTNGADPAEDHTATTDNKLAGVVIGGNEKNDVAHPMSYLESPAVDVSGASGKVFLTYYRWLDSDVSPYMTNVVEVNDGTTWNVVWQSGTDPILDAPSAGGKGWTFVSHDITQFKNAALKFRFGFDVGSNNPMDQTFAVGSWNLDDVKVQNTPCPK